ncbi:MAG: N-acetylmuramoyl-L-alanine amidase-like domain-containing protein [Gemmatimonadales bacterium]
MINPISRRELLIKAAGFAAACAIPFRLNADNPDSSAPSDADAIRLRAWAVALRSVGMDRHSMPLGPRAIKVGELAIGTPYVPNTLEAYIVAGGSSAGSEPLTVSLTQFDCVTLVEGCLAVARAADDGRRPSWRRFEREVERMRYRGGKRNGYTSRLHYFSEWILDGAKRGLVRDLGVELGGVEDSRPLRFMTEHRNSYAALRDDGVFESIGRMERSLDSHPRHVIPAERITSVESQIETGDVLAFATQIPGLDVTHAAFAYRGNDGVLRVLHAPLSGGAVEITRTTLPEYVARIRRATGILIARPVSA